MNIFQKSQFKLKPKKSYGQHFLKSDSIATKIVDSLNPQNEYQGVLEVGPGKGVLTKLLHDKYDNFFAIEADEDMVQYLTNAYPSLSNQIIFADFLKFNLSTIFPDQQFALIGNFPYNISSQIIFKLLKNRQFIPEMVGMFQKELAQRIIAEPGSKTYGVISVFAQAYYSGHYLFQVKNTHFSPPPKVQSAVIRLKRLANQELPCDEKLFRQIVKTTFGQRRKMLRNTLKGLVKEPSLLKDSYFTQRPERLSVDDFIQLTLKIQNASSHENEASEGQPAN